MAIHLTTGKDQAEIGQPNFGLGICGQIGDLARTEDRKKVTCMRCLAKMSKEPVRWEDIREQALSQLPADVEKGNQEEKEKQRKWQDWQERQQQK